ncbi:MAG: enoyl-CoA hydratase-related protein, partial [Candidatus Thermoplasmatota archaeon]|nr:enoyl-CoA hydratase-related protein [Candidatus Thermoplasmatota archaeon]
PILMPILEIISGEKTTDECSARTQDFAKSLGKDHVMVLRDVPGFLINRLNDRLITEAFSMLEEGHTISQLDSMARYRLDFPMGIFELLDFVGIDTVYNAKKELESRGFETVIHERLSKIVKEGKTGFKSGGGFYDYSGSASYQGPVIVPEDGMYEASPVRLLSPVINEAAWILRNGVSSAGDIEKAMKMAMNWPKGPLEYADIFGIDNVVNTLDRRHKETGHPMYVADSLLMDMKRGGKTGILSGEGFSRWKLEKFTYGPVSMTVHDAFALVTMNRPDKLNSLDEASWSGLREAFEAASGMDGVRTVILTGSGRAFCAGDDIAMMGKWKAGEAGKWMDDYARPLVRLLADYPKPTISAVNGPAFGGGCELAMLFDIVLASERAVFSLPEGLIGAVPPIASSYGYSIINRKLARYALTGERFSARQASDLDMVDIVVSHEQLMPAAIELAERISKVAPLSSESVKKIVNSARSMFGRQEEIGSGELVRLASTRDFEEGQRAFLGKRKPAWEGR